MESNLGRRIKEKHVNTQVVFYADRDKVVCHMYNTTQLILVNGHGYKKFIDVFLKPFLISKTNKCLEDIEQLNDEVIKKEYNNLCHKTLCYICIACLWWKLIHAQIYLQPNNITNVYFSFLQILIIIFSHLKAWK